MLNKESQAETAADSEQMPIAATSSPNAAKPNVGGSFSFANFLMSLKGTPQAKMLILGWLFIPLVLFTGAICTAFISISFSIFLCFIGVLSFFFLTAVIIYWILIDV